MKNGDEKFEQSLQTAIKIAEKYELQLPHVSDQIYALVKLVRAYDNNLNQAITAMRKAQKQIKYTDKFLKKSERRLIKAYMEGLYDSK